MPNKLAEILATKETEWRRLLPHADELRRQALLRDDFRPFRAALQRGEKMALIAEIKKASPSAGIISANFDPITIARDYERSGAHALSVLTDVAFFGGHLSYLEDIRQQVDLPLLRKDFIVHELQIYESVVAGADAILLIVAALEGYQLEGLYELAKTVQLDVLVEVHTLEEMERALDLGADIIGINNRNLSDFTVSLETTALMAEEIPSDCVAVSESGIQTRADVLFLQEHGINAMLIGEALMRSENISAKISELLDE
jgi:indole-3-glycerol phosphate synthase